MPTDDRPRTVTLPPLVLGGLRPLYRQMLRNHVAAASFEYVGAGGVVDICVLAGLPRPALRVRVRGHGVDATLDMSTSFRVEPVLDARTYRSLCAVLAPEREPTPEIAAALLREVVAQSPAVLAHTHACAA